MDVYVSIVDSVSARGAIGGFLGDRVAKGLWEVGDRW